MKKDELIKFLKENLRVEVDNNYYSCGDFQVRLYLKDEMISEDYGSLSGFVREESEW